GAFARVDRVGAVWVVRLDAAPWASLGPGAGTVEAARTPGEILINYESKRFSDLIIRETYDPGWRAVLDGEPVSVGVRRRVFLGVGARPGRHRLALRFDPPGVRAALWASGIGLWVAVFALTGVRPFRSTRIIADGLGRTRAAELKSDLCSSPAKH